MESAHKLWHKGTLYPYIYKVHVNQPILICNRTQIFTSVLFLQFEQMSENLTQ